MSRALLVLWLIGVAQGCTKQTKPLRQFHGATDAAVAVAWSPDAKRIAGASGDGTVRVWNVDRATPMAQLSGYERHGNIYFMGGLAFSPHGEQLAFGGVAGAVVLVNLDSGKRSDLPGQSGSLLAAMFTPDGKHLITASGGLTYLHPAQLGTRAIEPPLVKPLIVVVFDVESGQIVSSVAAPGLVNVAFSPDGSLFAGVRIITRPSTNSSDASVWRRVVGRDVQVRRTTDGTVVDDFKEIQVLGMTVSFSPDGKYLLSSGTVWDVERHCVRRSGLGTSLGATVFIDGGKRVLTLNQGMGLPTEFLATTRWVQPTYVDLDSGEESHAEKYVDKGLSDALLDPVQFSPDRGQAIDRRMRLWPVPR